MRYVLLKKALVFGIILLFVGTSVVSAINGNQSTSSKPLSRGNWLYVGGSGPGNYTTIQSAINATNPGDTVFVYDDSSPYFENVVVDKSINLIGEDRDTTIIDGNRRKEVVHINTNSVEVRGFTITKGDHRGIYCEGGASNITIASCVCFDNNESGEWGEQISLYGYQNCRIFDNIISSADREIVLDYENATNGIYIEGGTHNSVFNNSIYENFYGVKVGWGSNKNIVLNNVIELNLIGIGVFGGDTSAQNRISKNYVYRNFFGVIVHSTGNTIDNNTIVENGFLNIYNGTFGLGVDIVNWSHNNISDNIFTKNSIGVRNYNSQYTHIHNNTFTKNFLGIAGYISSDNNISNNSIVNNLIGIGLLKTSNYEIQWNDIRANFQGIILSLFCNNHHINYNNIVGNIRFGILGFLSCSNNAQYNWWGSSKGPRFLPFGQGDRILWIFGRISYSPWLQDPVDIDTGSANISPFSGNYWDSGGEVFGVHPMKSLVERTKTAIG